MCGFAAVGQRHFGLRVVGAQNRNLEALFGATHVPHSVVLELPLQRAHGARNSEPGFVCLTHASLACKCTRGAQRGGSEP